VNESDIEKTDTLNFAYSNSTTKFKNQAPKLNKENGKVRKLILSLKIAFKPKREIFRKPLWA